MTSLIVEEGESIYLDCYIPFEQDVTNQPSRPRSLLMTLAQDEGFGFETCVSGLWIQWWNGAGTILKAEDDRHASRFGRHG